MTRRNTATSAASSAGSVSRRPWLTRNLKVVSAVSFLQDAASELLYPILPIFLTSVLNAPVAVVGLVEGLAEGAAAAARIVTGRVADRLRYRPLIALGYGLAALGKILVAVATVWPVVLAGRGVDRIGKGVRGVPRDALIAADAPAGTRGRAFGFHRSMDTAGAVVGPLLGLGAYHLLDQQIRPLLLIAVVPAVLSVLLVAALREPPRPAPTAPSPPAPASWRPGELPTAFWRAVAPLTAFSLVNFPDALLLLRLYEIGFSLTGVILAYVGYNTIYALCSYPAGALADKLPPSRVFALGLALFAIAYTGLGLTRSPTVACLLLLAYGGFTACTDGVGKAWISGLAPGHLQGTAQGVFQGLGSAGILFAGIWAGLAWGADGRLPLLVSGVTAALLAVVLFVRRSDLPVRR